MHLMIRRSVEAVVPTPTPKLNSQGGSEVQIDGREKLLLLISERIEAGNRSVCGVVNPLREVVAHFRVG
jgi:hypothetical protein